MVQEVPAVKSETPGSHQDRVKIEQALEKSMGTGDGNSIDAKAFRVVQDDLVVKASRERTGHRQRQWHRCGRSNLEGKRGGAGI